jgi:hypothetical protein
MKKFVSIALLLSSVPGADSMARDFPWTATVGMVCIAQDDRYHQSPLFQSDQQGIEQDLAKWSADSLACLKKMKPISTALCKDVTALNFKAGNVDEAKLRAIEKKHAKEFDKITSKNIPCID